MLRNRRGATSLRWLRALLDHGIEVHGQVVVCPGVNDGAVLDDTLAGVLDRVPRAGVAVRRAARREPASTPRPRMRPAHRGRGRRGASTPSHDWQDVFLRVLGRRLVFAADEYYLLAGRPFPTADAYEGFPMHEDGIGMARTFEAEFAGPTADDADRRPRPGFFAWVDGAPADGLPGATPRPTDAGCGGRRPRRGRRRAAAAGRAAPVGQSCTGELRRRRCSPALRRRVLDPLLAVGRDDVRVVAGRATASSAATSASPACWSARTWPGCSPTEPEGHRYLLPDVCLSEGRFLDGTTPDDLPRPVEVVATDGVALRGARCRCGP